MLINHYEKLMIQNLIDTHCHIDTLQNLEAVLNEAKSSGVSSVIAMGEDQDSSQKVMLISENINPVTVYPAAGIHPSRVSLQTIADDISFIEKNINRIYAIGETGLDFWAGKAKTDKAIQELQIESFRNHLKLAVSFDLPVSVHSRGAWREAYELAVNSGCRKCVFHWFTGERDVLEAILEAGYYISATPALEYSTQLIQSLKIAPLERILLETDTPVMYKNETGRYQSSPKDISRTVKGLAKIKNMSEGEIASTCNKNALNIFNRIKVV